MLKSLVFEWDCHDQCYEVFIGNTDGESVATLFELHHEVHGGLTPCGWFYEGNASNYMNPLNPVWLGNELDDAKTALQTLHQDGKLVPFNWT